MPCALPNEYSGFEEIAEQFSRMPYALSVRSSEAVRAASGSRRKLTGVKARPASSFYFKAAFIAPGPVGLVADASSASLVGVFLLLAGAVCAIAGPEAVARKPGIPER